MTRPRVLRYCAAAVCIDCAFYLTLTGVPYKAIRLGASPLVLGILPTVWSAVYITGATVMGHLSDRMPRVAMARIGTLILLGALLILALTPKIAGLFIGMPIAAAGLSLFWPALQAAVADADDAGRLGGNLGWFNVSWSLGKGTGFLTGGVILERLGFNALFGAAMALILAVAVFLKTIPSRRTVSAGPAPALELEPEPSIHRRRTFLVMAWLANGTAYGVAATLNYHYPGYLEHLHLGSSLFGGFLGLVYFSQTLSFLMLMRTGAWHYRSIPLILIGVTLCASMSVLPGLNAPPFILGLAPLIGLSMGLAYYSSIYYSLHASSTPGRNTGLHEAIIGSGVLLLPLLGGAAATRFDRLDAPLLLAGAVCLAGVLVQIALTRRPRFRSVPRWDTLSG